MKINRGKEIFSSRYYIIVSVILILMAILVARVFVLSVLQNSKWTGEANEQSTKSIYTSAPRGNIYDRNGKVIATNKQIFTVVYSSSGMTTAQINDSTRDLINTLQANGDKYTDNFPIKIDSNGDFYYTYDRKIQNWLKKNDLPEGMSASQAFRALRKRYKISNSVSRYDAMTELEDDHNLTVPISAKTMTYTYTTEKEQFLSKWGDDKVSKAKTAKSCFAALRKYYDVKASLSDSEARKIFIIRNEIATNGFTRYIPITIAKGVSNKTIATVEESDIKGASISSQYKRYYPNGSTACHIIGYMGSISESETSYYVDKLGYSSSDLIGIDGLESSYESSLHGTAGVKKIKVNSAGEYVSTVSNTSPVKGKDVFTTIDLNLQKTAESTLKSRINSVGGSCQSGAVVVMSVKTGEVLAMASYPTYDPNIFAGGISTKAWKSVQADNPRDSLSPAPLYNNATKTAVAPGSTFKPITAVTALQCGLNPNRQIYDKGYIKLGGHTFACSNWNDYGGNHGSENLEWGIGNSCNYYFFCIATGKDWGTGASLGYNTKITVDKILKTAKEFGLGQKTGIELDESVVPLASAKRKMAAQKLSAWNYLYGKAHTIFPEKIANDYSKLSDELDLITGWIEENPSYETICDRLDKKTDIKSSKIDSVASALKYDYFIQAQWTTGDQFNISIGQGDNAYTPLQMATYISALGNNATYNRASVVQGVEGEGLVDKSSSTRKIDVSSSNVKNVIKGMKRVTESGTLAGVFSSLGVDVAGKTGTAENQGTPQPKSEVKYVKNHLSSLNSSAGSKVTWSQVTKIMAQLMKSSPSRYPSKDDTVDDAVMKASNYKITQSMIDSSKGSYDYYSWTVTMAPADDPQIAVATLLIQGGYSSNAAPVNKAIIAKYLELYGSKVGSTSTTDEDGTTKAN